MLSYEMINMLAIGGAIGVVLGSGGVFAFLKKKDINVPKVLDTAEEVLDVTEPAIKLAGEIAPNNKVVNIVSFIEHWTKMGVKNAQQLYHASKLTNDDDRKAAAKDTVYTALKEFKIEPTENQEKLIEDILQGAVGDLGHKEKSDVEKETEKQKILQEKQKVEQENVELKQKITQIQNTVATSV